MSESAFKVNRLANSTSPYLRSAARQPVQWYEWGEEAFQAAQTQDKPMLLDSGAVWCHWCHVIDRESYENPVIARIINELYVPVKIDRDQRPDIDRRYQEVVSAISGQGGWPLTVMLTPDGHVIYGGTYFPPEDRHGMPGLPTVLRKVAELYRTQKGQVVEQAKRLHQELSQHAQQQLQSQPLSRAVVDDLLQGIKGQADPAHGGFGNAPKFPHATTVELALWGAMSRRDDGLRTVVKTMLDGMARGGMRDQLGGAFHRYSTDQYWRVPHFEVLLDVNAGMLENYVHAWQVTRESFYQEVATRLMDYWNHFLSDQAQGGFFASQDADVSLEDDGDYWTWTVEEAKAALSAEEFRVLARYYNIEAQGEMRENPKKNVLYVAESLEVIAKLLEWSPAKVQELVTSGKVTLFEARLARQAPYIDRTIHVDWNGWMVQASLAAALAFGDSQTQAFALKTLDWLWTAGFDPARGMCHSLVDGKPVAAGLLEDQAQMMLALLEAYQLTQDGRHLERAKQLMDVTIRRFGDSAQGGFFDVPEDHETLGALSARKKPFQDFAAPPGNALAALALDQLAGLTGEPKYRGLAEQTLTLFAGQVESHGLFASTMALAIDRHLAGDAHVVITGPAGHPHVEQLLAVAHQTFRPNKLIQRLDPAHPPQAVPTALTAILEGADLATPRAFVCAGPQCAPPTSDPQELARLVSTFGL